jgi:hypothetical protein
MELVDHIKITIEDREFTSDVSNEDFTQKSLTRIFAVKKNSQMSFLSRQNYHNVIFEIVVLFGVTLLALVSLGAIFAVHNTKNASLAIQLGNIPI